VVESVISTNATIKVRDDPKAEPINVSRQRLSLCNIGIKDSSPWFGHAQKLRWRRKIHRCQVMDFLLLLFPWTKLYSKCLGHSAVKPRHTAYHVLREHLLVDVVIPDEIMC